MLNIKLVNRGTECELIMVGRLDNNSAHDAEKFMNDAGTRFDTLVLNMEHIEYLSSAGLRTLRRVNSAMRRKDGALICKNVTEPIMEVFEVTGFAGVLKFA